MCLIEVGFCSPWASSSDSLLLEEAAEAEPEATAAAIPADAAARGGLALPLLLGELFNDARRLAAAASISPFLVSSDESELRFAGSFLSIDAEVHVESSSSLFRDLFWLLLLVLAPFWPTITAEQDSKCSNMRDSSVLKQIRQCNRTEQ